MPETPIALLVPTACPTCGRSGRIQLQQTLRGDKIELHWHCAHCDEEWPVRRKEEIPQQA
jgi:transposase-like protein